MGKDKGGRERKGIKGFLIRLKRKRLNSKHS
jgi:hypothetical protein